jgi:hypothetical protein
MVQSQPGQIVHKTLSQKTLHKKRKGGPVEWLKVLALSSNPSIAKKKKEKKPRSPDSKTLALAILTLEANFKILCSFPNASGNSQGS